MAPDNQNTATPQTVVEISNVAELGDGAKALLKADMKPLAFVELLIEKKEFPDAARFLAHADLKAKFSAAGLSYYSD